MTIQINRLLAATETQADTIERLERELATEKAATASVLKNWEAALSQCVRLERELAEAKTDLALEQAKYRTVLMQIGTSCLTKDLVWCSCGRGISLTGNWAYCPRCGGAIDQESYAEAVTEALKHGAALYRDSRGETVGG